MTPHLVRWQNAYASQGLTILYVDDGQRDPLANARQWPRREGVSYPVFHDTTGAATRTYDIRAYPTAYVIDRSGKVAWEGIPLYGPQEAERAIQAALQSR